MPYYNKQRDKWMSQIVIEGVRHRCQHDTRQEALLWEEEQRLAAASQGSGLQPSFATISLKVFADLYLKHAGKLFSAKTVHEKRLAFLLLFNSVDSDMPAFCLLKSDVLAHFAVQASSRSGNAANKDRKNLVAAWNWAIEYLPEFPSRNPFATVRFPEDRSPRRVPSEADFWAVHAAAESEQDKLMLLCFLHLAARRTEIFQLRTDDVDLAQRQVRLFTRKRKDGSQQFDWLPMTDRLCHAMAMHLSTISGPWVFPDPGSGKPYVARNAWLARLCARASVKPFGLHGIRHLSASILIKAKVSLLDVQSMLRHANLVTTQRYVHRIDSVRRAVEVFERPNESTGGWQD